MKAVSLKPKNTSHQPLNILPRSISTLHQQQIPDAFLTQEDLCGRWQKSLMTIWRMRRDGVLPSYKIGSRGVRFKLADILKIERDAAA